MQRRELLFGALAASIPAGMAHAQATDWPKPTSTIRYIVPFPPGGLTDVMARNVSQAFAERWKVNVVVDNRAGGGGQIGAEIAAKANPDGNTLLAVTLTHAANYTLFPRAPYNYLLDLKPVALLAGSPMLIVVPMTSKFQSLNDLIAAAKSSRLNAGSSGNGTPPHLTMALFNQLEHADIQHVPYKGGAPSISDLMGGQLDVIFSNFPESIAQVKAGKLRALAICSSARHPAVPEVPTTAELGLPQLLVENWTGIMVPSATPDAIVDEIGAEAVTIMKQPVNGERAKTQGFRVDARGPREFASFVKSEVVRWGKVINDAHIVAE